MNTPNDVIGLLDYFAAAALSGIIFEAQTRIGEEDLSSAQVKKATEKAYKYASMVIAARAAARIQEELKKQEKAREVEIEPA